MKRAFLAQGIVEGGLYKLLSQYDSSLHSNTSLHSTAYISKLSSLLSVFFNNRDVNSSQESNNQMFVDQTCQSSVLASFLTSGSESIKLLHNKFGHPNKHALQIILRNLTLNSISKQSVDFCDACQCGKMHQLHFSITEIKSKAPLELLHTDLWKPTSKHFMDGYKYYISFVDDFTRYCWIFPLTFESEALETFKHFKLLNEKQFSLPIKAIQSHMGGEFLAFKSFL